MPIRTRRLLLLPGSRATLEAELRGPDALAAMLGVAVHPSWPPPLYDEDAIRWMMEQLEAEAGFERWGFRYFVLIGDGEGLAVGAGGFKGPPTADGTVEIGYSVVPTYQRRGLATEAVEGMVERAFGSPEVRRVIAETLPTLVPSIRVLEKSGFTGIGEGSEPGVIRFERRRPS